MSLKDRLNSSSKKIDTQEVKENSFMMELPLSEEFSELKEKLHALLIDKVNTTPNWSQYSDVEQKNLIKQFIEYQISTNFRSTPDHC